MLPVVHRELAVASRQPWTHWMRFSLAGSFVLFLVAALARDSAGGGRVETLFFVLSAIAAGFGLASGPMYAADTLSSEKRDGTLGLLFLTDLRSYDVVLGKLATSSLRSSYALLGTIPVLALPMLLGGITASELGRAVLVMAAALAMSLSVAMLWSAVAREFRTVVIGSSGTLFVLLAAGPSLSAARGSAITGMGNPWLSSASPWFALSVSREAGAAALDPLWFQRAMMVQAIVAAAAFVAACLVVPHSWRWTEPGPSREARGRFGVGYRHIEWRPLLERSPYAWLIRAVRPAKTLLWLLLLPCAAVFLAASFQVIIRGGAGATMWFALAGFTAYAAHQIVKWMLAVSVTQTLADDRQSGGLELMMVSGLGPHEIVDGMRRGWGRQFAGAFVILTGMNLVLMILALVVDQSGGPGLFEMSVVVCGWGIVLLYVDGWMVPGVGMRWALREADSQRALRSVLARYFLPGWFITGFIAVFFYAPGRTNPGSLVSSLLLSGALYAPFVVFQNTRVSIDLETGFRHLAAGLSFDTGDWVLRRAFQKAAMMDVR